MDLKVHQKIYALLSLISRHNAGADLLQIEKALLFAEKAHRNQLRVSGEPYITHPIAVAEILVQQNFDSISVITAILHDTVEDTEVTLEDIEKNFSATIASLVDGITKLKKIDYKPHHVRQAENFRKLLFAMSKDIRVLVVKLADRMHNMRTIGSFKDQGKQIRIAHETLEIYAPLAERIGIEYFQNQLEDLAFEAIYPDVKNSIKTRLSSLLKEDILLIEKIKKNLYSLMKLHDVQSDIYGRQKTYYSTWKKMERKKINFDQLSDIIGFRIIVSNIEDCYKTLGIIHLKYRMVVSCFKDYINNPKDNGYKSIHTVVISEEGHRLEIQIRTKAMDRVAKFGLATHWVYKHKVNSVDTYEITQFQVINELMISLQNSNTPEAILENSKVSLYKDLVFCFMERGDLISLPNNSTILDFAFAVNSKMGLTCVGGKVNDIFVDLDYVLHNGDKVEIITDPKAFPEPSWENFAYTAKAKYAIKKALKTMQRLQLINLGRSIMIQSLEKYNISYNEIVISAILDDFNRRSIEDLLLAIGNGVINKLDVIQAIHFIVYKKNPRFIKFAKKFDKFNNIDKLNVHGLLPNMKSVLGNCCNPLPGDKIIGIIHSTQGVVVHLIKCPMLKHYMQFSEKWINLSWNKIDGKAYIGKFRVLMSNKIGSLAIISSFICESNYSITNIKVTRKFTNKIEILLEVELQSVNELYTIIKEMKKNPIVYEVERFFMQK